MTYNDYCSVNVTIEYIAGSSVYLYFRSASSSKILLNNVPIYTSYYSLSSTISSQFSATGVYILTIRSYYSSGAFGLSYKVTQDYSCPSNCYECGATPLSCKVCKGNASFVNVSCECPSSSTLVNSECQCDEGYLASYDQGKFLCAANHSNETSGTEDNATEEGVTNNINIDIENDENDQINIDIDINLHQQTELLDESRENEIIDEDDAHEVSILSLVFIGFASFLALLVVVKAGFLIKKYVKGQTEIEPQYQLISN